MFRGKGRPEKIHQKSPAFFNVKFPGKFEEKMHTSFLESGPSKKAIARHEIYNVHHGDCVPALWCPKLAGGRFEGISLRKSRVKRTAREGRIEGGREGGGRERERERAKTKMKEGIKGREKKEKGKERERERGKKKKNRTKAIVLIWGGSRCLNSTVMCAQWRQSHFWRV